MVAMSVMKKDIKAESAANCLKNIHFMIALVSQAKWEGSREKFSGRGFNEEGRLNSQLVELVSRTDSGRT